MLAPGGQLVAAGGRPDGRGRAPMTGHVAAGQDRLRGIKDEQHAEVGAEGNRHTEAAVHQTQHIAVEALSLESSA